MFRSTMPPSQPRQDDELLSFDLPFSKLQCGVPPIVPGVGTRPGSKQMSVSGTGQHTALFLVPKEAQPTSVSQRRRRLPIEISPIDNHRLQLFTRLGDGRRPQTSDGRPMGTVRPGAWSRGWREHQRCGMARRTRIAG
jgi:hypothetical protein